MKLKILSVHGQGDYTKEHVILKAQEDCDLKYFVLSDTTYTGNGKISNKVRHTYWFRPKQVNKGDLISVWTGRGEDTLGTNKAGHPIHRFYWGLEEAVWNDEGDRALLMHIDAWKSFPVLGESKS